MTDNEIVKRETAELRKQLDAPAMKRQFAAALAGGTVNLERFIRVVMTAINQDPDLLAADRQSFFNAAMQCAQDGLVPDKREAAFVVFNTKEKRDGKEYWIKKVQHMPMYQGIMKKVRGSGEIAKWVARAVRQKDPFEYEMGDNEYISHKPYMGEDDPGPVVAAYSIATFKDGTVQREVMTRRDIERVRMKSKNPDRGPWKDSYDEMARKTVIRRAAKQLPLSPEAMEVIARDDGLTVLDEDTVDMRDVTPPRPRQEDYEEPPGEPEPPKEKATTGGKAAKATKSEKPAESSTEDQAAGDDFPGDKPFPGQKAAAREAIKAAAPNPPRKTSKPAETSGSAAAPSPESEAPLVSGGPIDFLANWNEALDRCPDKATVDALQKRNAEKIAGFSDDDLRIRIDEATALRKEALQ